MNQHQERQYRQRVERIDALLLGYSDRHDYTVASLGPDDRERFEETSATDIVAALNTKAPVERKATRRRRPVGRLFGELVVHLLSIVVGFAGIVAWLVTAPRRRKRPRRTQRRRR